MIIEGRNSVREAVRSLTQLDKIYIQNDIKGREMIKNKNNFFIVLSVKISYKYKCESKYNVNECQSIKIIAQRA